MRRGVLNGAGGVRQPKGGLRCVVSCGWSNCLDLNGLIHHAWQAAAQVATGEGRDALRRGKKILVTNGSQQRSLSETPVGACHHLGARAPHRGRRAAEAAPASRADVTSGGHRFGRGLTPALRAAAV